MLCIRLIHYSHVKHSWDNECPHLIEDSIEQYQVYDDREAGNKLP